MSLTAANSIKGSIVAIITPMLEDGSVDYASLTKLVEFHIASGTHGIVSVGTTGESATLSVDEHLSVIEHTVQQVASRIPVIAGTGANSTQEAIELTGEAEKLGADACLLVVPYYNKPTQEGLYQHFKAIANAVPIAQVLYNVPGRTITDMETETTLRLADIDNVVAIKDATGDLERGKELIDAAGDRLTVLSGDDPSALGLMKLGGKGNVSVTANVVPDLMSRMCELALAGDFDQAEELNAQMSALNDAMFVESNPIPVKYAMSKLGFGANSLRLPLTPLSAAAVGQVDLALGSIKGA